MRSPIVLALLTLPQLAWADCIYTGAKRAYLECIYAEVVANATSLFDHGAELIGLDTRLDQAELDIDTVAGDVTGLMGSLSALEGTVNGQALTLSDHDTELGTLAGDVADLQTTTDDLAADVAALQGGGGGSFGSGSVVQTVVATSTTTSSLNTTTFTEPHSSYRVSITPQFADSLILVEYGFGVNTAMASNTIFHMQLVRGPGGTNTPVGVGPVNGTRQRTTFVGRPGNGYDTNDELQINFRAVDTGFTAGVPVTYGFLYRRETGGSGTTYFNHSNLNNSDYGFSGVMTITATEIRP